MTVTSGGAAGIGIGCTIGGILICGLVFYLVGRRRRILSGLQGGDHKAGNNVEEEIALGSEKTRPVRPCLAQNPIRASQILATRPNTALSHLSTSSSSSSDTVLSLGNNDTETKSLFHQLNVAIRCHAQTYYTTTPTLDPDDNYQFCSTNLSTLEAILAPDAPVNEIAMHALLQTPEIRIDAIRLLIAWAIFKYIQPNADIERTLLPPELVKCAQAMSRASTINSVEPAAVQPVPRSIPRKPLQESVRDSPSPRPPTLKNSVDEHIAFAKWRETSGKLFEPIYGDGVVGRGDSRDQNVGELVTTLVCLLQPYVATGYGGARVKDLEKVIKMGAAFGYRLFTQRPEWEFAWSTLMSDEIVVYPALVKIGDEKGKRLRKSIVLDWEEVVKLPEPTEEIVSVPTRASVHKDVA